MMNTAGEIKYADKYLPFALSNDFIEHPRQSRDLSKGSVRYESY